MTEVSTTTPPPAATPPAAKDRTWTVLCHISALAAFLLPHFGAVIGPLVVWLARKDVDPEVREHGREALNFNISFLIWHLIGWALVFVVIGILVLPIVFLTWIVLMVIGTMKASDGVLYKYPFTIRFID